MRMGMRDGSWVIRDPRRGDHGPLSLILFLIVIFLIESAFKEKKINKNKRQMGKQRKKAVGFVDAYIAAAAAVYAGE